jgi:hypothetical protein
MRNFKCICGQLLFFENTHCTACLRKLGYDPSRAELLALEPAAPALNVDAWSSVATGACYRLCSNSSEYNVCNWLVSGSEETFCLSCSLNQVIPEINSGYRAVQRRKWWGSMELAKRRLIYTLLSLGLPVISKAQNPVTGLAFAFLEDQRANPMVLEKHVLTGHARGLITVNLAEADHVHREYTRQHLGEPYRTLLGHFRHESGHYYFEKLVPMGAEREAFRALFGDERADYEQALAYYYANDTDLEWRPDLISPYAQVHPLEDWAECWAHYLHMIDTLETAYAHGIVSTSSGVGGAVDIEECLQQWAQVSVTLNALNRSMGLEDAYPFVLSDSSLNKLRFVHRMLSYPSWKPMQTVASV